MHLPIGCLVKYITANMHEMSNKKPAPVSTETDIPSLRRFRHFSTSCTVHPRCSMKYSTKKDAPNRASFAMRITGLEPARQGHQNLNLARLPIPPYPHILKADFIITFSAKICQGLSFFSSDSTQIIPDPICRRFPDYSDSRLCLYNTVLRICSRSLFRPLQFPGFGKASRHHFPLYI